MCACVASSKMSASSSSFLKGALMVKKVAWSVFAFAFALVALAPKLMAEEAAGAAVTPLAPMFGGQSASCPEKAPWDPVQPLRRTGSCQASEFCSEICVNLSCSGTTCSAGSGYIICDGNRTDCPTCQPPPSCASPEDYCGCRHSCGGLKNCLLMYC